MIYALLFMVKKLIRVIKTKKLFSFGNFYFFMTPTELIDLNIDDEILAVVSFYSPFFFFLNNT
jgi:hypothetical protein